MTTTINTNNALEIAEVVLGQLGGIAHHTRMVAHAKANKLNPNDLDLATKVWSDCKKNGDKSKFVFLGKGCFCLATYTGDRGTDSLVPARAAKTKSAEDIQSQIKKLEEQLAALRSQLAEVKTEA